MLFLFCFLFVFFHSHIFRTYLLTWELSWTMIILSKSWWFDVTFLIPSTHGHLSDLWLTPLHSTRNRWEGNLKLFLEVAQRWLGCTITWAQVEFRSQMHHAWALFVGLYFCTQRFDKNVCTCAVYGSLHLHTVFVTNVSVHLYMRYVHLQGKEYI